MTQNPEWNHILDAAAYLQSSPSFSITEICSVPCDLSAKITIPNRRGNEELKNLECAGVDLGYRQDRMVIVQTATYGDIYEVLGMNEIKTDCKYYSGEHLLFCAVNVKCDGCVDYCPEVRGDRHE